MNLDQHWTAYDPSSKSPSGYYSPGSGLEYRANGPIQFVIDQYQIENDVEATKFSTRDRVDLILRNDFTIGPDRTIVCFPGWGETSAMLGGDFLDILIKGLKENGAKNPSIIFPNIQGRGTRDYAMKNSASTTGFRDAIGDAKRLANRFVSNGDLNGDVTVMGHSMGYIAAWEFVRGLMEEQGDFNLKKITGMMPGTDEAFGPFKPEFLWAVKNDVALAILRYATKESLAVSHEEYNGLMYGDQDHADFHNYVRSVPDSARVFLDWVFNPERKELPLDKLADVDVNILWSKNDKLLPKYMGRNEILFLNRNGVKCEYKKLMEFSHAIPFDMSEKQMGELSALAEFII